MHEKKNILANVPTQDERVGLHMLTLMDINTYNKKNTENMETLKLVWREISAKNCLRYRALLQIAKNENYFRWTF